jgi:chromosome segregation ATPase
MDQKQLEKKVTWLDKQRQKDAETIARLTERLEGNNAEITGLAKQMKEMTSELARITGSGVKAGDLEDAMRKYRQEVSRLVEKADESRGRREKNREKAVKSEREQLAKISVEIKDGLRSLKELREAIEARKAEEIRIIRTVGQLEERMEGQILFDEEKALTLASMEEGRKHDSKRLSDIQAEGSDLRERIELLRGSLESMDDRLARNEVRLGQAVGGESERRESQELWMEQQAAKLVEFEREWKTWAGRFDVFEKRAAEIDERTLAYDETYRTLRQLQTDLSSALERLDRRIHEIGEMQRLAEDRSLQEWATFQADEQKRWNTHKLTNDERWREHTRAHEKLVAEVGSLSENVKELMLGLGEMRENDRQRVLELLSSLREWAADFESRPSTKS